MKAPPAPSRRTQLFPPSALLKRPAPEAAKTVPAFEDPTAKGSPPGAEGPVLVQRLASALIEAVSRQTVERTQTHFIPTRSGGGNPTVTVRDPMA